MLNWFVLSLSLSNLFVSCWFGQSWFGSKYSSFYSVCSKTVNLEFDKQVNRQFFQTNKLFGSKAYTDMLNLKIIYKATTFLELEDFYLLAYSFQKGHNSIKFLRLLCSRSKFVHQGSQMVKEHLLFYMLDPQLAMRPFPLQVNEIFHQSRRIASRACNEFARPISASLRPGNSTPSDEVSQRW